MGMTTTASGAHSFRAFCTTIEKTETRQTNIFTRHIILDDEDDESFQPKYPVEPPQSMEASTVKSDNQR